MKPELFWQFPISLVFICWLDVVLTVDQRYVLVDPILFLLSRCDLTVWPVVITVGVPVVVYGCVAEVPGRYRAFSVVE